MKKLLVFFAIIVLAITVSACGSDKPSPNDNETTVQTAEPETTEQPDNKPANKLPDGINPDEYAKFVQFDLPENFREAAVAQMRKQATVEWTPEYTFSYGNTYDNWGFKMTYTAGKKYTGLPYGNMNCNMSEFQKYLDEHGGKFAAKAENGYNDVMGTQCSTAINLSFQTFFPEACKVSDSWWPSYHSKFIGINVGSYEAPDGMKRGVDIVAHNGEEKMYESYALADMGDVIISKDDERAVTHVRMVAAKAVVARGANGQINPNRSYLVCIEQTDSFDSTRKDVNTTWWVDHKYTFASLYQGGWVPVSLECYKDNVSVYPYIALDEIPTADMLAKGTLGGTVSTDYTLNYIHLSIYDKAGNLVNRVVKNNSFDGSKENLRKHAFNLFNDSLKAGTEYTFVLDAGIAAGNAELCRVDFTYNG
ncbi:MAG: hypothetical protein IJN17_08910 [Clostridia bacterium]|nr:hypothetical protein [Clostridia bacterium]